MQRKWRVSLIVCVGVFMASLDLFIVNIAFPEIARDFRGSDLGSLSWILNAYAIVFAALLVPAGRWADAFGRKRVFLSGLAVFIVASTVCALAPSVEVLVAARVVQAAGAALMVPTSLGLMLPEFESAKIPVAIGIWSAVGGIAAAAGPPIGGLLVELDWRWVFLVNLPIGAAALVAGMRTLGEIREPAAQRPDIGGAALLIGAVSALVVAIVQAEDWGWGSPPVLALFAGSALLLAGVAARSAAHPVPLIDPAMVRVRSFSLALAASLLFYCGFGVMLLGSVLFLTGVRGEDVLTAGLMVAPGPAMAALFSVPSARLGGRVGFRLPGVLGTALFAIGGLWWLTQARADGAYATSFLPGMMIGGAGVGLVIPTLTGAATASLPPARFATGAAVITMGRQIGSALGVALLVAVLGTGALTAEAFDGAWKVQIGAAFAAGLAFAALGRPSAAVTVAPVTTAAAPGPVAEPLVPAGTPASVAESAA